VWADGRRGLGGLVGLQKLNLSSTSATIVGRYNSWPRCAEARCSLAELEDLNLAGGGLVLLSEGVERLTRLRTLDLLDTKGLTERYATRITKFPRRGQIPKRGNPENGFNLF
jgi:hypothetical protein